MLNIRNIIIFNLIIFSVETYLYSDANEIIDIIHSNPQEKVFKELFSRSATELDSIGLYKVLNASINNKGSSDNISMFVLSEAISLLNTREERYSGNIIKFIKPYLYYCKNQGISPLTRTYFQDIINRSSESCKELFEANKNKCASINVSEVNPLDKAQIFEPSIVDINKEIEIIIKLLKEKKYDEFLLNHLSQKTITLISTSSSLETARRNLDSYMGDVYISALSRCLDNINVHIYNDAVDFLLPNLSKLKMIKENNLWKIDDDFSQDYSH